MTSSRTREASSCQRYVSFPPFFGCIDAPQSRRKHGPDVLISHPTVGAKITIARDDATPTVVFEGGGIDVERCNIVSIVAPSKRVYGRYVVRNWTSKRI